jgi:putative spermidine/putrescine transport system permease protein
MVKFLVYALLFVCLAVAVRGSIRGLRNLPPYVGPLGRAWYIGFRVICGAILLFLIMPILVIIPLSFNAEPYFTYPMPGFSLRWYEDFFVGEQSAVWHLAIKNSTIVAIFATFIATALGTIAAVGLSNSRLPGKTFLMGLLISPMIVPLVITAVGMYFFYSVIGFTPRQLSEIWSGLHLVPVILAHAALGTPFVVITVTATLVGFDQSLIRASASLGADGIRTFFKITVPLVMPGMISGALFALPSTKWSWCCSWPASRSTPFRDVCSPGSASRSARRFWRWPRSWWFSPYSSSPRWNFSEGAMSACGD